MEFAVPSILEKGNLIFVEFQLDDKEKSMIHREVEICSVHGKRMGGLFTSEQHQDQLRNYLEEQGLISKTESRVLSDCFEFESECIGRPWDELLSIFS